MRYLVAVLTAVLINNAGANCYTITDKDNKVVYQSTEEPYTLGTKKYEEQRAKGYHLIISESNQCDEVVKIYFEPGQAHSILQGWDDNRKAEIQKSRDESIERQLNSLTTQQLIELANRNTAKSIIKGSLR